MNNRRNSILISILLTCTILLFVRAVYSEDYNISILTDKEKYNVNEKVTVIGSIAPQGNFTVTVHFNESWIETNSVNGLFTATFKPTVKGTYIIYATVEGVESNMVKITVEDAGFTLLFRDIMPMSIWILGLISIGMVAILIAASFESGVRESDVLMMLALIIGVAIMAAAFAFYTP